MVSLREVYELFSSEKKNNSLLLDVRTPAEYRACHISFSRNIPLDTLEDHLETLKKYERIFVHCKMGGRSQKACAVLTSLGCENVVNIDGGIEAWQEQKLPVVRAKSFCK